MGDFGSSATPSATPAVGATPPATPGLHVRYRHRVAAPETPAEPPRSWLVVRTGRGGELFYEAAWRHPEPAGPSRQMKRRLGLAWLESEGNGGTRRRRGRPKPGYLDEHAAVLAKDRLVREVERELAEAERAPTNPPTFRRVAHT